MTGQDALNIAREHFPDANEETLWAVLWEFTGWPAFWDGDPETCLRKQLNELRDSDAARVRPARGRGE